MISPAQCRAARGLLNWSRPDLARQSGVSVRTIAYFEDGERNPTPESMAALIGALDRAGVEFMKRDGVRRR